MLRRAKHRQSYWRREVERTELRRSVVSLAFGERGWLDDGRAGEVIVEDGLAVGLEYGLGRHFWLCVLDAGAVVVSVVMIVVRKQGARSRWR